MPYPAIAEGSTPTQPQDRNPSIRNLRLALDRNDGTTRIRNGIVEISKTLTYPFTFSGMPIFNFQIENANSLSGTLTLTQAEQVIESNIQTSARSVMPTVTNFDFDFNNELEFALSGMDSSNNSISDSYTVRAARLNELILIQESTAIVLAAETRVFNPDNYMFLENISEAKVPVFNAVGENLAENNFFVIFVPNNQRVISVRNSIGLEFFSSLTHDEDFLTLTHPSVPNALYDRYFFRNTSGSAVEFNFTVTLE